MERFAAMVTSHRASHVPTPAPAPAAKGKGKAVEDTAYLSIQLEEIVIVKNDDDIASLGAARGRSNLTSGASTSTPMGQRVAAAAAPPSAGMSGVAATAAHGASSRTAGTDAEV